MTARTGGLSRPMSIFEHHVAHCSIALQHAIRAARSKTDKETSDAIIAVIHKLHRLETLYREMGGGAVFGTPEKELTNEELRRLFPD